MTNFLIFYLSDYDTPVRHTNVFQRRSTKALASYTPQQSVNSFAYSSYSYTSAPKVKCHSSNYFPTSHSSSGGVSAPIANSNCNSSTNNPASHIYQNLSAASSPVPSSTPSPGHSPVSTYSSGYGSASNFNQAFQNMSLTNYRPNSQDSPKLQTHHNAQQHQTATCNQQQMGPKSGSASPQLNQVGLHHQHQQHGPLLVPGQTAANPGRVVSRAILNQGAHHQSLTPSAPPPPSPQSLHSKMKPDNSLASIREGEITLIFVWV